jgi:hypothetical protein
MLSKRLSYDKTIFTAFCQLSIVFLNKKRENINKGREAMVNLALVILKKLRQAYNQDIPSM